MTEERAGRGLVDGPRAYEALTGQALPTIPARTKVERKVATKRRGKKSGANRRPANRSSKASS